MYKSFRILFEIQNEEENQKQTVNSLNTTYTIPNQCDDNGLSFLFFFFARPQSPAETEKFKVSFDVCRIVTTRKENNINVTTPTGIR